VYKNKIVALLIASILMLAIALPACTCGGAPAPEEPAPAPAPAPEPEPEPAAAPGECAAPNTLWENDMLSVCYPEKWSKNDMTADIEDERVLYVADPAPSTPPIILIYVTDEDTTVKDAAYTAFGIVVDSLAGPGTFDPEALKVTSEAEVTIASGEAATDLELKGDLMGFPVKAIATITKAGDTTILACIVTVDIMAPYKKDEFMKITHSLFIK